MPTGSTPCSRMSTKPGDAEGVSTFPAGVGFRWHGYRLVGPAHAHGGSAARCLRNCPPPRRVRVAGEASRRDQVPHSAGDSRAQGDAACHQAGLESHPPADGVAFVVVGVEHDVGSAGENCVELPCQIGGVLARQVAPALADVAIDRATERAAMIGSQLLGIAVGRYILGIPPLVGMDNQTLARWLKPVLTHYLTGPAPDVT